MSDTSTTSTPANDAPIERGLRLVTIPGGRLDIDEMARDAAQHAEARNLPLMLRMQPDLYFQGESSAAHRYKAWPSVIWKAEFPSAEELVAFRLALEGFMVGYFAGGAEGVTEPVTAADETGA